MPKLQKTYYNSKEKTTSAKMVDGAAKYFKMKFQISLLTEQNSRLDAVCDASLLTIYVTLYHPFPGFSLQCNKVYRECFKSFLLVTEVCLLL